MADRITNEFNPDFVPPPGETLRETLDALGMTQKDLAQRTGRPAKMINEIVMGKAPITLDTALQFERVLGIPVQMWANLERAYREHLARHSDAIRLAKDTQILDRLPVRDMIKHGWVERQGDKVSLLTQVLEFFGVATVKELREVCFQPVAAFRMSRKHKSEPAALAAWLRKGELDARRVSCDDYDKDLFLVVLKRIRELTCEPHRIMEVPGLAAEAGVAVVFVPPVSGVTASGAARWLTPAKALVQLSLRYKRDDQVWFSLFHEAAHVVLHAKRATYVDRLYGKEADSSWGKEKEEEEADYWASRMLIPQEALEKFYQSANHRSEAAVRCFAERMNVCPGVVVGRMQHDGRLPWTHLYKLKAKFDWA